MLEKRPISVSLTHSPSLSDLRGEIHLVKTELQHLKEEINNHNNRIIKLENDKGKSTETDELGFLNAVQTFNHQRWYANINIVVDKDYTIHNALTLLDSGADLCCIREGLVAIRNGVRRNIWR